MPGSKDGRPGSRVLAPNQGCREAEVRLDSYDQTDNSVEIIFSTGADVRRYDWSTGKRYIESLPLSGLDLSQLNADAQVLRVHGLDDPSLDSILGVVKRGSARTEMLDGKLVGICRARLSTHSDDEKDVSKIKAGIIRKASYYYTYDAPPVITTDPDGTERRTFPKHTGKEVSFVPIAADGFAGSRSAEVDSPGEEEMTKKYNPDGSEQRTDSPAPPEPAPPTTTPAESTEAARKQAEEAGARRESERRDAIETLGRKWKIADDVVAPMLKNIGCTVDQARFAFVDTIAERTQANPLNGHIDVTQDEGTKKRTAFVDAFAARGLNQEPPEAGREFRNCGLTGFARRYLEMARIASRKEVDEMYPSEVAKRAMQSTDFSLLLGNSLNKILLAKYVAEQLTFPIFSQRADFDLLNERKLLRAGEGDELLDLEEGEEYAESVMGEGQEAYSLFKSGRILALTLETFLKDDIGAFVDPAAAFGNSSIRRQEKFVYSLISTPQTMGDGKALFHADHKNIASSAGVPTSTRIDEMDYLMTQQLGIDGKQLVGVPMAFLIAPRKLKQQLEMLLGGKFVPTKAADTVTEDMAQLRRVYCHYLDVVSTVAWFGCASPSTMPTLQYGYLRGEGGPVIEKEDGFSNDTIKFKCRLFFGARIPEWRAWVKNAGA